MRTLKSAAQIEMPKATDIENQIFWQGNSALRKGEAQEYAFGNTSLSVLNAELILNGSLQLGRVPIDLAQLQLMTPFRKYRSPFKAKYTLSIIKGYKWRSVLNQITRACLISCQRLATARLLLESDMPATLFSAKMGRICAPK